MGASAPSEDRQCNEGVLSRLHCAVRGLLQRLSRASDPKGAFRFRRVCAEPSTDKRTKLP